MRTLLTIGEVADLLHLSTSQIRFYEKKDLLKPHHKDINGYRLYSYAEVDTLEFIANFRNVGVSISEIKEFINRKNDDNVVEILDKTTGQIQQEIKKLTQQVETLNELKEHFKFHLSTSSQVIPFPERTLYIIDDDIRVEKKEKDVYDFFNKYNIDYRYHEQQFYTLLIDDTLKLCLFSNKKNEGLRKMDTYILEKGNYFTCNTEVNNYRELNSAYAFVYNQSINAGYTPVGHGFSVEDITTLLLSKTTVRLNVQIRIKE